MNKHAYFKMMGMSKYAVSAYELANSNNGQGYGGGNYDPQYNDQGYSGTNSAPIVTSTGQKVQRRDTTPINQNSGQADRFSPPQYRGTTFRRRQDHLVDNYLHHMYGNDDAIRNNYSAWDWLKGDWSEKARRRALMKRTFKGFNRGSSKYNTYVDNGDKFSSRDLQSMIGSRADELASRIVKDSYRQQDRQRLAAYFRMAANQTLNDMHRVGFKQGRPGEPLQRRHTDNGGTPLVTNFNWHGFTPEQIKQAQAMSQLMMADHNQTPTGQEAARGAIKAVTGTTPAGFVYNMWDRNR